MLRVGRSDGEAGDNKRADKIHEIVRVGRSFGDMMRMGKRGDDPESAVDGNFAREYRCVLKINSP